MTEVTHACPPVGSGVTPCCGRTPFELPRDDKMTLDPGLVTCRSAVGEHLKWETCACGRRYGIPHSAWQGRLDGYSEGYTRGYADGRASGGRQ